MSAITLTNVRSYEDLTLTRARARTRTRNLTLTLTLTVEVLHHKNGSTLELHMPKDKPPVLIIFPAVRQSDPWDLARVRVDAKQIMF